MDALKPLAKQLITILNTTPVNTSALETLLTTYPFPPRKEEDFSYALGQIITEYKEPDNETLLRLQIFQLVYNRVINS